ncbi:hypothetical protein JCM1393_07620 [Clostridium carnis]
MDERYSNLIKNSIDEYDEVGVWWEIDKNLAEKAGVKWRGETPVDDHVNIGYSLGYSKEDRVKMVDIYMTDFKDVFGYYPKSVGSWVIDITTLNYFKEKYDVVAAAICRDQIGTDGFTLWGGYFNQGYYPSKVNEYMPAQNKENQIDLPIFRLLGPDPIYSFEDALRKGINDVYTLEPAGRIGSNKMWIEWFFDRLTKENNLGFSYAQVGQENTFLWNTMAKGYEIQIPYVAKLAKEGKIRVETLEESGNWFKKRYKLTPATTVSALEDWNKEENLKTIWYNSRFYRVSFLIENNRLSIRDLHLFNENYKSRYLNNVLNDNESIFDTLPILNDHYWSNENSRASIDLVLIDKEGNIEDIKGEDIKNENIKCEDRKGEDIKCEDIKNEYIKDKDRNIKDRYVKDEDIEVLLEDDSIYKIKLKCSGKEIYITCNEDNISFELKEEVKSNKILGLYIKTLPVLKEFNNKVLTCCHNNFKYNLEAIEGKFKLEKNSSILVLSNNNKINISFNNNCTINKNDFFNNEYIKNKEEIDSYIPKYKRINSKSKVKPRAFSPIITPKVMLKEAPYKGTFTIENPNENGNIYYTLDGSEPSENSHIYNKPINVEGEITIKAIACSDKLNASNISEGKLYTTLPIKDIKGFTRPTDNKKYNKNGVYDLIDGRKGTLDYKEGGWLGYTDDMDVVVDLGEVLNINKITVGFLQDTRAWIYYPRYVEFFTSVDGENFKKIDKINYKNRVPRQEVGIENISIKNNSKVRYIRIFAKSEEVCPKWSIMKGEGPAFMFVDAITCL